MRRSILSTSLMGAIVGAAVQAPKATESLELWSRYAASKTTKAQRKARKKAQQKARRV